MVTVSHIDTCFPDHLTDHHNRTGELLIGVSVTASTTYAELREELLSEFTAISDESAPSMCELEEHFDRLFAGNPSGARFDDSLELEYDDEAPQAWFLITWTND